VWEGQILGGTQPANNDEVLQAFRNAYGTAVNATNVDSYKLFIKSLCMDIQITNTGDKNMVVEMYSIKHRKNWTASDRMPTMLSTCITELENPTGFTFTSTDPGYTLFQVPQFCQYWSITQKQQIVLSANETTTLQIRIPMNKMVNGKAIETYIQSMPWARGFFWSAKGAPEANAGLTDHQYADGSYVWASQTTVNYQMPPANTVVRSATQI